MPTRANVGSASSPHHQYNVYYRIEHSSAAYDGFTAVLGVSSGKRKARTCNSFLNSALPASTSPAQLHLLSVMKNCVANSATYRITQYPDDSKTGGSGSELVSTVVAGNRKMRDVRFKLYHVLFSSFIKKRSKNQNCARHKPPATSTRRKKIGVASWFASFVCHHARVRDAAVLN